jgi:hypothetical protein
MKCIKCDKKVTTWQDGLIFDGKKIELPPHCSDCKDIVLEEAGLNPRGLIPAEEPKPPTIPDENIDAMIDLSDDIALWVKLVPGGFQFANHDKIVPELVGKIVSVVPYLINFEAGDRIPAKLPHVKSDLEIPEGYSRRCDVKILTGGQIVGISLAPSSMKFQLSPYLKYLRNQGLRPEDVVTRITSKQVSNNMGTFQVVVFVVVNETGKPVDTPPKRTPSETPPKASSDTYPDEWA